MDQDQMIANGPQRLSMLKSYRCKECGYTQEYHRFRTFMDSDGLGSGSGPVYGPFPDGVATVDWRSHPEIQCRCRLLSDLKDAKIKASMQALRLRGIAKRFGTTMMDLIEKHCSVREVLKLADVIGEFQGEFPESNPDPEDQEDEDQDG
jgi:hypothetical protein